MRRKITVIAAALALLALGAAIGRWSAPARTEDRIVLDERERVVYLRRVESVHTDHARDVVRWRWTETKRPDGTLERETVAERNHERETRAATTSQEGAATIRERHIERVRTVEAERPRLMLGAHARLQLDGRIGWGPQAAVRVAGPVVATAAVDVPRRALMLGVGVWW